MCIEYVLTSGRLPNENYEHSTKPLFRLLQIREKDRGLSIGFYGDRSSTGSTGPSMNLFRIRIVGYELEKILIRINFILLKVLVKDTQKRLIRFHITTATE